MAAAWEHPQLGKFNYEEPAWEGTVQAPAFDVFTFDDRRAKLREPEQTYRISFEAEDENEKPSAEEIAVALAVLAEAELPKKLMKALWDDFNGRGPKSGMWWHGQLEQVADGMAQKEGGPGVPKKADDLRRLLRFRAFKVRKEARRYDKPVVELSFDAAFEVEHGLSVLTDGNKILGTGYNVDVGAFVPE